MLTNYKLKGNWGKHKTESKERDGVWEAILLPMTEIYDPLAGVTFDRTKKGWKEDRIPILPVIWPVEPKSMTQLWDVKQAIGLLDWTRVAVDEEPKACGQELQLRMPAIEWAWLFSSFNTMLCCKGLMDHSRGLGLPFLIWC